MEAMYSLRRIDPNSTWHVNKLENQREEGTTRDVMLFYWNLSLLCCSFFYLILYFVNKAFPAQFSIYEHKGNYVFHFGISKDWNLGHVDVQVEE